MSWNYRIVKYKDEDAYGLHEVFYNEAGEAWSMTERPVGFVGDTKIEVLDSLSRAFADASQRPVFQEPEQWASREQAQTTDQS